VRALVRRTSDLKRLDGVDVELAYGDVADRSSVDAAMTGVDVVFHCAALVELGPNDPARLREVNVGGTHNVLEAASASGALAVHVSSVSAHGPTGPTPVDESWWADKPPTVAYEAAKRDAHLLAQRMANEGASVRIASPGGIYGYGDVSSMAQLIETFSRFPTPVGYMPELVQSLVNVDDCADALLLIAERGSDGDEYLVSADTVTFREWFELIAFGAGRHSPIAYVPTGFVRWSSRPVAAMVRRLGGNAGMITDTVEIATRHQAFSGERARRELGWAPRDLRQGMVEMCGAFRRDHQQRHRRRGR
jgi:nucleoside-diphosphate-sugar epimerase